MNGKTISSQGESTSRARYSQVKNPSLGEWGIQVRQWWETKTKQQDDKSVLELDREVRKEGRMLARRWGWATVPLGRGIRLGYDIRQREGHTGSESDIALNLSSLWNFMNNNLTIHGRDCTSPDRILRNPMRCLLSEMPKITTVTPVIPGKRGSVMEGNSELKGTMVIFSWG